MTTYAVVCIGEDENGWLNEKPKWAVNLFLVIIAGNSEATSESDTDNSTEESEEIPRAKFKCMKEEFIQLTKLIAETKQTLKVCEDTLVQSRGDLDELGGWIIVSKKSTLHLLKRLKVLESWRQQRSTHLEGLELYKNWLSKQVEVLQVQIEQFRKKLTAAAASIKKHGCCRII